MSTTGLEVFDKTLHLTNVWLNEIMAALGTDRRTDAWHALRAVLTSLRDRLPPEEAAHLSAQLPLFVRGIFFEGWRPGAFQRIHTRDEFLARVRAQLAGQAPLDAELACRAVFATLHAHVTAGELADVRDVLPGELKSLLEPV
jgi:uncharacterized protein (DUF2267 family)